MWVRLQGANDYVVSVVSIRQYKNLNKEYVIKGIDKNNVFMVLGKYSTQEKSNEVFYRILEAMANDEVLFQMPLDNEVEVWKKENVLLKLPEV